MQSPISTSIWMEFGVSYGSGGIGALVQPLIGERVFGTLKPNRLS